MWFFLWKSEDKCLSPTFIRLHFHFTDASLCKAKLELMYFHCIVYYWNYFIFPKQCLLTNYYYNKTSLKENILRNIKLKQVRNATKTQFSTFTHQMTTYAHVKYYQKKMMMTFCTQHQKNQIFKSLKRYNFLLMSLQNKMPYVT